MPKRAKIALVAAAGGLLLLFVTWLLAFHVAPFRDADQSIFNGFWQLHTRGRLADLADRIASLCDPKPFVVFSGLILAVALLRRRWRAAGAICVILLGANVTTQLLKPLLAEPRADSLLGGNTPVAPASWPSGHATAAMSLALCCVIAMPARLRPIAAALGALFAAGVSYSFLTLGWHYPSDVFGGYLVAAIWTLVGVAVVFTLDARWPRRALGQQAPRISLRSALTPPAGALIGAAALAGLVALARPHQVLTYARAHEAFMVGAAAIAVLGLILATGVTLLMSYRYRPGSQSGSSPSLAARLRMNSRSESRFR